MTQQHVPGESGPPVEVSAPRPPEAAPADVDPAVVEERADGSGRYICYAAATGSGRVAESWLSVDLDTVVARELWR